MATRLLCYGPGVNTHSLRFQMPPHSSTPQSIGVSRRISVRVKCIAERDWSPYSKMTSLSMLIFPTRSSRRLFRVWASTLPSPFQSCEWCLLKLRDQFQLLRSESLSTFCKTQFRMDMHYSWWKRFRFRKWKDTTSREVTSLPEPVSALSYFCFARNRLPRAEYTIFCELDGVSIKWWKVVNLYCSVLFVLQYYQFIIIIVFWASFFWNCI